MLVGEPRKRYYINPSCCCFRYSFDELRTVLADPIGCSALSEGADYYQSLNFPLDVQPFDMLPSQHGGGIVVAHAAMEPNERWLPEEVLLSRADGSTQALKEETRDWLTMPHIVENGIASRMLLRESV